MFNRQLDLHQHNTRNKHLLQIGVTRTKSAQKSLRYTVPKIVNETSYAITDKIFTHSFTGYSTYIKTCIWNKYNMNCEIIDCYICNNQ